MKSKKISLLLLVIILTGIAFQSILILPSTMNFFGTNPSLSTSANFYAISESDNPTKWILQGADITAFEDFHDDISGSNWNLYGVSNVWFDKNIIQSVNYQLDNTTTSSIWGYSGLSFYVGGLFSYPEDICWDGTYYQVVRSNAKVYEYTSTGEWTLSSFNVGDEDIAPRGICWDGTYYWVTGDLSNRIYKYTSAGDYTGVNFYFGGRDLAPMGICWDGSNLWVVGAVNKEVYKYTSAGVYTGVSFYVGDQESKPSGITWREPYLHIVGETHKRAYKYQLLITISKKYQGSGYMYMQTNITESLSLLSTDYGTHYTLSSGDYFEVDFQTNSDSKIELLAYKDEVLQQTLTLSQSGNTNFNRHTAQIIVSGSLEFDQLKIRSMFEDTDYMKVWDIKTFKYVITGDYADFVVGSKQTHIVNLTSDTYNLRISDPYDGDTVVNENITIGITDRYYVYEPIGWMESRLTLFNIGKEVRLEFIDYHISINRSLYGIWDKIDLLENIFSVDIDTNMEINVSDQFGTLVYSDIRTSSSYIELELDVYRLQIKSLMESQTTVVINYTYSYPLLPDDSLYFMLSEKWYQIEYTDDDGDGRSFLLFLDSNKAFVLNRSQICFLSYTDQQGNHLYFEDYKTYINSTLLYENIFYEDIGDTVSINITDRYDIPIYFGLYTVLSENNYIPIILDVYELKLKNMQDEFNNINITRSPYPISGDTGDIIETGNYPATYSFDDQPVGTSGTNIYFLTTVQSYLTPTIIDSYENHKRVIEAIGTDSSGMHSTFSSNQISGIIEYYFKSTGATITVQLRDTSSNYLVYIQWIGGQIRVYYGNGIGGSQYSNYYTPTTSFPHFKIEFNCITDTISVWCENFQIVNNVNFMYDLDATVCNNIRFHNNVPCIYYIDAVGYSWDSEYNIGDNINDYYYLGSEPFENYNQTTEGVYYGTYDFRDELGETGTAISWITGVSGDDTGYSAEVIAEEDSHTNIIKFLTNGDNGKYYYWMQNNVDQTADGTTIEFWCKYIDNGIGSHYFYFSGCNGGQLLVLLQFSSTDNIFKWFYGNGAGGSTSGSVACVADIWHHIKVIFDFTNDNYDVYLNGVLKGEDKPFYNDVVDTGLANYRLQLDGFGGANSGECYLDAVGESWDSEYDVGDNINSYGKEVITELENEGWTTTIKPYTSIGISGEYNLHKKILNLTDNSVIATVSIFKNIIGQLSGTIEFWIKIEALITWRWYIGDGGTSHAVVLGIDSGEFKFYDGVWHSFGVGIVPIIETWYHIRIDFECGTGGYEGLSADTFHLYWNGIKYVSNTMRGAPVEMDKFGFYTNTVGDTGIGYIDALAYSWEEGYEIGDNYNYYNIESDYSWSSNIAPDEVVSFRLLKGFYNIWMTNTEETKAFSFRMFDDTYFILNRSQMCFLSYQDVSGDYLNFRDYITKINDSIIYDNYFYGNIGDVVNITIRDYYNTILASQIYTILMGNNYIPITLNVYELKIKNEALEQAYYSLENIDTTVIRTGYIFSEEIITFSIALGDYSLDYINYEDMYPRELNFELTDHKTITINTTYHTIYFSMFTYDGLGINPDLVRFYINGFRKDFGFNIIQSETANLVVLDFFNNTMVNETIDASIYSEYNIFVEIYSLIILNQFTYEDIIVNITQIDSGIWMTQIIPKQFGLTYRFLPNVVYNITIYFTNATLYTSRILNLTDNSHIESFGVATGIPEYPKNVYFGIYTTTGLGINRDLLRFYIDGDRVDFGFNRIENMIIEVIVKDYFNSTLFNQNINTSGIYEYNILITLYSLKVKNEARIYSNYTLNLGALKTTGYILPEEIIEYQLASNNYAFDYTNNEDGSSHTFSINLNQDRVYILNTTYYNIYFSLYDVNLHIFYPNQYEFRVNNTIQDLGLIEDLQSDNYNITIKDRFGTYLFNSIVSLRGLNEYRIDISLYELQIRHLAYENSNLTLYETTTHNCLNFSMGPDTIRSFILASSTYNITWINGENMLGSFYNITLNENYILTLDTTYFDVYFALFTYDGLGVSHDVVRFYINGFRKDFGFNTLTQHTNTLTVLDYFNQTLLNTNLNLEGCTEYNIFIEVYTMILYNNYSHPVKIKIERNHIEMEQIIESHFGMPYRMLPNVEYELRIYYLNGTLIEEKEIELDSNNKIVSFGFYEEEVLDIPSFDNTSLTIFLIILIFIGIISLPTYLAYKYNKKVQNLKRAYKARYDIDKDIMKERARPQPRSSRMTKIK